MQFDNQYIQLDHRLYHKQNPQPLNGAIAGHFNQQLARQLAWNHAELSDWINITNGACIPQGADPLAMVYAGHQFGQWAGQLGDGRGLLLGQVRDTQGHLVDLHLKGAGKTPFSRMGDGRAVLRSVIREYLAGHAMNSLGVASSNAVGFIASSHPVHREQVETGAMLLRTSDCHVRLGHFEWLYHFHPDLLPVFTEQMMLGYFPDSLQHPEPLVHFVHSVIERTAKMIANWQLVGFAHGVMNTDNFNITGSTLDFGPYVFLERFDPTWIHNHSDHQGRYRYQDQPSIAHWNLWMWLNHLQPLFTKRADRDQIKTQLQHALNQFEVIFLQHYKSGLCQKMGLRSETSDELDAHVPLGLKFLQLMQHNQLDYCNSFIALQQDQRDELLIQCEDPQAMHQFFKDYDAARQQQDAVIDSGQHNPHYILRLSMLNQAITDAEKGNFAEVDRLFQLLSHPFQAQPELARAHDILPPALGATQTALSCSS